MTRTRTQARVLVQLRRDIDRLDRRARAGARKFKRWIVRDRPDGTVHVVSVVGWPTHPFDDIRREITIGRRGGLRGYGSAGHDPRAGDTPRVRGPRILYDMNARRAF